MIVASSGLLTVIDETTETLPAREAIVREPGLLALSVSNLSVGGAVVDAGHSWLVWSAAAG